MELIPGRACGECSACCVVPNVDTPEFQKFSQTPCTHLRTGGGCAIHATRFPVCRTYHCAWRYLKGLSEEWRPDKSGILLDFQMEGIPAHYPKRPGIRLTPTASTEALFAPACLTFLSGLVFAEVPVVLSIPGPPGHFPAATFLNDMLREAVNTHDADKIVGVLRGILAGLARHSFSPVVHRYAGQGQQG